MFESISFVKQIEDLHVALKKGSYLLLIAEETPFLEIQKVEGVEVCGAIFPRVIFKGKSYAEGIIVARLNEDTMMQIIDIDDLSRFYPPKNINSVLTIVDGFSSQIDDFLEAFYALIPENTKLIGGGAGTAVAGLTGNRDIDIPAESILKFRLADDLTVQPGM